METANLHRILKSSYNNPVGTIKKPDGTHTVSGKETIEFLIDYHFPDSAANSHAEPQPDEPRRCDWNCAKRIITKHHVRLAIKSFQPHKAPGPDKIIPRLLQEGLEILELILTNLFEFSLALG